MERPSALLYDPVLDQNLHSRNIPFLPKKMVKKGYYGNEDFGLNNLAHFYTILSTSMQSRTKLKFSFP